MCIFARIENLRYELLLATIVKGFYLRSVVGISVLVHDLNT